jgi:signal transduction histidine kinase/ActR/RegA family two-component response regulator
MELLSKEHRITEKNRMDFQPFGRRADGIRVDDVSGVSMRGHIACLEEIISRKSGKEAAAEAVEELASLLNERIRDPSYHVTPEFLKNPWNSYSHEFAVFLPSFASILSGDPEFHIKAGKRLVQPMIRTLGRPFSVPQIFKMIAYFGNKYAKAIRFESIGIEETHATIRVTYSENSLRQFGQYQRGCVSEICATIKAGFSTVPQAVHGLLPAIVTDRACIANGDPYCEYGITWESEERSRWGWIAAITGMMILTFFVLRLVAPQASLIETFLLALIPAAILGQLRRRIVLARELRRQSEIIDEQARTTDARHEELREAYLEQEERTADLQRKVNDLTLLHNTGLLLTSSRNPEELISSALRTLVEGLNFDRALLSFFDSDSSALNETWMISSREELAHSVNGFKVQVHDTESVEAIVLLGQRPLLVKNSADVCVAAELMRIIETTCFIAVPLTVKDRNLGLLMVGRLGEDQLNNDDLDVMVTLANQLAVGIDNVRAYREIEELNVGLESKVQQRTAELAAANSRLKELDNLKSQFLAHVSHELRTPLTNIQGFADNMLAEIGGPLTDKQKQSLKRITANTGRLHRMIANLLNQSRIEAGRIEFSPDDVLLPALVRDVIEHMQPVAQAKQQSIKLICTEPQLTVWGDADKLSQVLTNVIDNAVKYSPSKSNILVKIKREEESARVSVTDSGTGIPRAALSKVFDAFYRAGGEQHQGVKGFGLGLSIVRSLIELHGGQIAIESDEGKGTSFHIQLPVAYCFQTNSAEKAIKVARILVADDDADIRQFLIDRLQDAGFALRAAETGREAIELAHQEVFDGAILDIGLTDIDGIQVLQYFRAQNLNMPVLMITAAEARERAMHSIERGAKAYLLKPFDANQFERAVLQCFGKSAVNHTY